jgi:hypothetical protein
MVTPWWVSLSSCQAIKHGKTSCRIPVELVSGILAHLVHWSKTTTMKLCSGLPHSPVSRFHLHVPHTLLTNTTTAALHSGNNPIVVASFQVILCTIMDQPRLGQNPHQAKFCIQFGFPHNRCCAGCVRFAESSSIGISIDSRDTDLLEAIDKRLLTCATRLEQKTRGIKFKSKPFICQSPWLEEGCATGESIVEYQKQFILEHFKVVLTQCR